MDDSGDFEPYRDLTSTRCSGGLLRRVLVSFQAEKFFNSTIALVIREQYGHNLEGVLFGRHPETHGRGKIVSPDAFDAAVFDPCRPHLEQTCWEYHAVVIEQE